MAVEHLPEGNGIFSDWQPAPPDVWVQPGMLPSMEDRVWNGPFNPFRMNQAIPPAAPDGNYWRSHYYNTSPVTARNDYYKDRANTAWSGEHPYCLEMSTRIKYNASPPREKWGNGGPWPLEAWSQNGVFGAGPGVYGSFVTMDNSHSYHTVNNMLVLSSYYMTRTSGSYASLGWTGRNNTLAWRLTADEYHRAGVQFSIYEAIPVTHTYRFSCWARKHEFAFDDVKMTNTGVYPNTVTEPISLTNDWQYLSLVLPGKDISTSQGGGYGRLYIQNLPPVWETGFIGDFDLCDIMLEDLTVTEVLTPRTVTDGGTWVGVRSDSASASVGCFQSLYNAYDDPPYSGNGLGNGGWGDPTEAFKAVRDRSASPITIGGISMNWAPSFSNSVNKSGNAQDRSYGGYKDPRWLSNPCSASWSYSRWMAFHPFCMFGWYWEIKGSVGASTGQLIYDWTQIYDQILWEMRLPSDLDPDWDPERVKPYTWIRWVYDPAQGTNPDWRYGFWRTIDYDGDVEVIDSRFNLEVCAASFDNYCSSTPCFTQPETAPAIPHKNFLLYQIPPDWDDRWPSLHSLGAPLMTITPHYDGSRGYAVSGNFTLTGVTFSGAESTYTLNTASDLGMPIDQTIYGCVMSVKPTDFPTGKAAFMLIEETSLETDCPEFITPYTPYNPLYTGSPGSPGGLVGYSNGGYGSNYDLTQNYYGNSMTVGIQPYFKIRTPRWRYGIDWASVTSVDEEDPPLRMEQRDDGSGMVDGHPRLRTSAEPKLSSTKSVRLPPNNTYR